MEKAYDIGALVAKLKARGLEASEDAAKGAIDDVFAWVEESAKLSSMPYDDLGLGLLPKIKDQILKAADKIDGQVG